MVTLGERLRERRHAIGMSLGEISQKLKIRLSILEALEADQLHVLPPVYMRQFARRYGEFLGIPEIELRQLCEASFGKGSWNVKNENAIRRSARAAQQQTTVYVAQALIYGGLVGVLVAVGYYFFLRPQPTEAPVKAPEVVVTVQGQETPSRAVEAIQPSDTVWVLRARARDTVWLSVVVDGRQSEQLLLHPGQEREWRARRSVLLSVGNAGGIELWRDGEALPPLGPQGAVLRAVRIERERLWSSAQFPYREGKEEAKSSSERSRAEPESPPQVTPAPLRPVRDRPQPQRLSPLPQ